MGGRERGEAGDCGRGDCRADRARQPRRSPLRPAPTGAGEHYRSVLEVEARPCSAPPPSVWQRRELTRSPGRSGAARAAATSGHGRSVALRSGDSP